MDNAAVSSKQKNNYAIIAACAALVATGIMIVCKGWAWYLTGSVSVMASLADSLMDAMISMAVFGAIRYSTKPADDDHRYGHGKIEGMVALMQGAFLIGAAALLLLEAISKIQHPESMQHHNFAMAMIAFSIAVTAILNAIQIYCMKHTNSIAIEGDYAHYVGDIWINIAVIAALYADSIAGPAWIDPLVGALVALYLIHSGKSVGQKGYDMLMDKELPQDERQKIIDILDKEPGMEGWHDLRTRQSGMRYLFTMDIEVDPDVTLKMAHDVAHNVEDKILKLYPDAEVMIHMDPTGQPYDSRHPKPKELEV